MSYTYCLVCIDTKMVLDLGKIVCIDKNNKDVPWKFSGFGMDIVTGNILSPLENWHLVERFLILNRGKEIRLLPDDYLDKIDPEGIKFEYIESVDDLMRKPLNLDYLDDINNVPQEVKRKLQ